MSRGFFAIGVEHTKTKQNIGTLWRSANLYDAAFVFTVGARYDRQSSDTMKTPRHIPLHHFATIDDLLQHLPYACPLIGVELTNDSTPLSKFSHPERACYLLGAEDHGLTARALERVHHTVQIESAKPYSMNVAVAGSIVLHHRYTELGGRA